MLKGTINSLAKRRSQTHFFKQMVRAFVCSHIWVFMGLSVTLLFFAPNILNLSHIPYDFQYYHFPLLYENITGLLSGEFPLWDASAYSGYPYVSNPQTGVYYPLNYIPVLLKLVGIPVSLYTAQYIVIIHFFLGLMGFYLWLQSLHFQKPIAFYGACLYSVCGYVISQYQHLGVVEIFCLIPYCFICIQNLVEHPGKKAVILLAIVHALILFTGFLPMAFAYLFIGSLYYLILVIHKYHYAIWKPIFFFCLSALLCFLFTSVFLLPILKYYSTAMHLGIQGGCDWKTFLTTFFSLTGARDQVINFYIGTLAPVFILIGVWGGGPHKTAERLPAVILIVGFLWILSFDPISSKITLAMSKLGSFGALWRGNNFSIFFSISLVVLFATGVKVVAAISNHKIRTGMMVLALVSILQLFIVQFQAPLYAYDGASSDYGPDYFDFNQKEVLKVLQSDDDVFRIMVEQRTMGAQWNGAYPVWDLECINGFDPMMAADYSAYINQDLTQTDSRLFGLLNPDSDALKWLNVKYYLTNDALDPPFQHDQFECVYDDWYNVYAYKSFMPRYCLSKKVVDSKDSSTVLEYSDLTDAMVTVLSYRKNSRTLFVENPQEGALLYLGERNYSGWRICVNGQEAPVLKVNHIFMGIRLPEGPCRIELKFLPSSFIVGLLLSGTSILCVLILGVVEVVQQKFINKKRI